MHWVRYGHHSQCSYDQQSSKGVEENSKKSGWIKVHKSINDRVHRPHDLQQFVFHTRRQPQATSLS